MLRPQRLLARLTRFKEAKRRNPSHLFLGEGRQGQVIDAWNPCCTWFFFFQNRIYATSSSFCVAGILSKSYMHRKVSKVQVGGGGKVPRDSPQKVPTSKSRDRQWWKVLSLVPAGPPVHSQVGSHKSIKTCVLTCPVLNKVLMFPPPPIT